MSIAIILKSSLYHHLHFYYIGTEFKKQWANETLSNLFPKEREAYGASLEKI
jgi:hypothetical protein